MSAYIQYHNYDKEGLLLTDPAACLGIHTRLSHVQNAVGGQVFLIFGIGSPRQYYLWDSFTVEKVEAFTDNDGKTAFHATGSGWYLFPPQRLEGPEFDEFRKSCANFVGFRRVDHLPFARTLKRLADQNRNATTFSRVGKFIHEMQTLLKYEVDRQQLADYFNGAAAPKSTPSQELQPFEEPLPRMRALSIRQPHAEAIIRGVKKTEYRSGPTKIRGRILIYASLGRYSEAEEAQMMRSYGINDVGCDDLPRGVIVGSVELYDCDEGDWHVRQPERATTLRKPTKHPQPVWFNPF